MRVSNLRLLTPPMSVMVNLKRTLLVLIIFIGVASLALTAIVHRRAAMPYKGYVASEQFVDIPAGSGAVSIADRLVQAGVVRDRLAFRYALWWNGQARGLKAGEYRFTAPMTAIEVVDTLARGDVYLRTITFPEGLTIRDMAKIFEGEGMGTRDEFTTAARDTALVQDLDPAAKDLEGYLFPDTYALPRRAPAGALVKLMVTRFKEVFDQPMRQEAAQRGLTARQVVTLASLVEKETSKSEELPLVASVYLKRLEIGMPLQADPTVIYALERAGRYDGNIHRSDLTYDSPYNTYKNSGLPPGPIAAPGAGALRATVNPAPFEYLYFVSRNDGSHVFARTLTEHNANVHKYQIQYFRDRR